MVPSVAFPRLTPANHRDAGPATPSYNCVAWAAENVTHWWQPGTYWKPDDWPNNDFGIGALEQAFTALGYVDCGTDDSAEPGFLKVALYGSGLLYTHAARQLPSGWWTSKLGKGPVVEHETPDVVAGGLYGEVVQIMKRPT